MNWIKNLVCSKSIDKIVELAQDNIKMYDAMILITGWLRKGCVNKPPTILHTFIDADNEHVVQELFDAARDIIKKVEESKEKLLDNDIEKLQNDMRKYHSEDIAYNNYGYVPIIRDGKDRNVLGDMKEACNQMVETRKPFQDLAPREDGLREVPYDYYTRYWKRCSLFVPETKVTRVGQESERQISVCCQVILGTGEQVDARYHEDDKAWYMWREPTGIVKIEPIMWRYRKDV